MTYPDDILRSRLAKNPWTGYNIRLSPNVSTKPDLPEFLDTDRRLKAIVRLLSVLYGPSLAGKRVVDLGCLEGGFSLAMAQLGATVLGVDARESNLDKATLLRDHFAMSNLDFVQADVKEFTRERFGTFDVILALGILYHLESPVRWLRQIAEATRSALIVDTHLAPHDANGLAAIAPNLLPLGGLETRIDGGIEVTGRWFAEPRASRRAAEPWAAFSNDRSFWLTKESLVRAINAVGFSVVLEQYDWMLDQYIGYTSQQCREMFIGLVGTEDGPH
jgi:SAM-dependent methyltransferase